MPHDKLNRSMSHYLIQILLPLVDNEGQLFPHSNYRRVRSEMTERFGGLTAFTPAQRGACGRRTARRHATISSCSRS